MKIEKGRNFIKVTFRSESGINELAGFYEKITSEVPGIYLPADVQTGKDGMVMNIRHRETLKTYLEKNILDIGGFVALLKGLKKITGDLSYRGYDIYGCVWDIDAVFIGNSLEEPELVYLRDPECGKQGGAPIADLLAVVSLHVFDQRESVIETLSAVVRELSVSESSGKSQSNPEELLSYAFSRLSQITGGGGMVMKGISAVRSFIGRFCGKPLFKARPLLTETLPAKARSNGRKGLESRLIVIGHARRNDRAEDGGKGYTGKLPGHDPSSSGKILFLNRDYFFKTRKVICGAVSRDHAEIGMIGRERYIRDRGSLNGTYLNGELLMPGNMYRLKKGDMISLAHNAVSMCCCRSGGRLADQTGGE